MKLFGSVRGRATGKQQTQDGLHLATEVARELGSVTGRQHLVRRDETWNELHRTGEMIMTTPVAWMDSDTDAYVRQETWGVDDDISLDMRMLGEAYSKMRAMGERRQSVFLPPELPRKLFGEVAKIATEASITASESKGQVFRLLETARDLELAQGKLATFISEDDRAARELTFTQARDAVLASARALRGVRDREAAVTNLNLSGVSTDASRAAREQTNSELAVLRAEFLGLFNTATSLTASVVEAAAIAPLAALTAAEQQRRVSVVPRPTEPEGRAPGGSSGPRRA